MSSIYTEKWVLFLDILGFGDIINNKEDGYKESEEFAEMVLPLFDEILNELQKDSYFEIFGMSISQFSDTFVVSSNSDILIMGVAKIIQSRLLKENLLSRGAITYGKVFHNGSHFHNGSQFIGPAITSAYNLEKSEAIYPRVIIDPDCEGDLKISLMTNWNNLNKDFDGYQYVPFINGFQLSDDIQKKINELYEKYKNTKHRGKYTWLKQKADEFVQNTK